MRTRAIGFLVVLLLFAQPASVAASAYSPLTYAFYYLPPGYSQYGSACDQSAILDIARNYNQAVNLYWVAPNSCTGASYTVPAGYLGTKAAGYRDGSLCATSSVYYSNVATSAWQLWIYLCSNPSGSQTFYTVGTGYFWAGQYGYARTNGILSPSQNY